MIRLALAFGDIFLWVIEWHFNQIGLAKTLRGLDIKLRAQFIILTIDHGKRDILLKPRRIDG